MAHQKVIQCKYVQESPPTKKKGKRKILALWATCHGSTVFRRGVTYGSSKSYPMQIRARVPPPKKKGQKENTSIMGYVSRLDCLSAGRDIWLIEKLSNANTCKSPPPQKKRAKGKY